MSYTPTEIPVTTRSVPTSHIGPVRGVRDSYGTVLRMFYVFTIRWHVFMLKANFLQLYDVHSNWEPVLTRSVPMSHIGPVRGVRDSYGTVLGFFYVLRLFYVFTLQRQVFMIKFIFFIKLRRTLQPGASELRRLFLRVTLVPHEVFVALTGPF